MGQLKIKHESSAPSTLLCGVPPSSGSHNERVIVKDFKCNYLLMVTVCRWLMRCGLFNWIISLLTMIDIDPTGKVCASPTLQVLSEICQKLYLDKLTQGGFYLWGLLSHLVEYNVSCKLDLSRTCM